MRASHNIAQHPHHITDHTLISEASAKCDTLRPPAFMNWCLQLEYVCRAFLEKLGNARTFFLPVHRWKFRQAGSLLLNRCSHLDLRPPVLRGKVSDNIHISCLSGLCFCEFLIELSPSVEWRGFPKVLLRKELTAAAWKKKEAFGSRHHHHHHHH